MEILLHGTYFLLLFAVTVPLTITTPSQLPHRPIRHLNTHLVRQRFGRDTVPSSTIRRSMF